MSTSRGAEVDDSKGSVASRSILTGVLTVGMEVESGVIITKDVQGKHRSYSIFSHIVTVLAECNS